MIRLTIPGLNMHKLLSDFLRSCLAAEPSRAAADNEVATYCADDDERAPRHTADLRPARLRGRRRRAQSRHHGRDFSRMG